MGHKPTSLLLRIGRLFHMLTLAGSQSLIDWRGLLSLPARRGKTDPRAPSRKGRPPRAMAS